MVIFMPGKTRVRGYKGYHLGTVRVGLQPVCKCKRVIKGFRTGYIKTGHSTHTMLGRQVTYNSIICISVDYYMQ